MYRFDLTERHTLRFSKHKINAEIATVPKKHEFRGFRIASTVFRNLREPSRNKK